MRVRLVMVAAALVPLIAATYAASADPMAPADTSPAAPIPADCGKRSTATASSLPAGS